MAEFYPQGQRQAAVGLPLGRDAALPRVWPALPGHRLARAAPPAAGQAAIRARATGLRWTGGGTFGAVVHEGPPRGQPTLVTLTQGRQGAARQGRRLSFLRARAPERRSHPPCGRGLGADTLSWQRTSTTGGQGLPRTDGSRSSRPRYRRLKRWPPSAFRSRFASRAERADTAWQLRHVRPSMYGAKTYGDFATTGRLSVSCALCRIIGAVADELTEAGASAGLRGGTGRLRASVLVRKLKQSTRGELVQPHDTRRRIACRLRSCFATRPAIAFSYDYFETGLGDGPGTWPSVAGDTMAVLRNQAIASTGLACHDSARHRDSLPLPSRQH